MQRLQRDDELCRGAIRVGNDVLLGEARYRISVDFGNDQRNVLIVAPCGRVIDDDAALLADLRRPLLGHITAGRHQANIGVGKIVVFEVRDLQRAIAIGDFRALRTGGSKRHDFIGGKTAFGQDIEHFATDVAGGACNCNFETHDQALFLSLLFLVRWEPALDRGFHDPRPNRGESGGQRRQTVLIVVLAVIRIE
ncbi:hypothetical protein D3C72_1183910 [compost metagenome]